MFCLECGNKIDERSVFCPECGTDLNKIINISKNDLKDTEKDSFNNELIFEKDNSRSFEESSTEEKINNNITTQKKKMSKNSKIIIITVIIIMIIIFLYFGYQIYIENYIHTDFSKFSSSWENLLIKIVQKE